MENDNLFLMEKDTNQQNIDKEIKFSQEQGFFEKSIGIRFVIGLIFLSSLFTILHFREVSIEMLELGNIAPSYVVAQTDIEFFDKKTTIILKQKAIINVGKIYQIAKKSVNQYHTEFNNLLITNDK